jgi:hypothetical protein
MPTSLWAQGPATGLIAPAPEAKLLRGEGPKEAGFIRLQIMAFRWAPLTHFIYELFKKYDNAIIYLIKLKSPKSRVFFAQAGKPVPPGSLPPGEFSGLKINKNLL